MLRAIEAELARRARTDLRLFVKQAWPVLEARDIEWNWHIDAICDHLAAVSAGQVRNLVINVPPRHMKSYLTCVLWPVWEWLARPATQFILASYAAQLSVRDNVRARRLIESPWMRRHFPALRLTDDQNQKIRFDNTAGGYRIATSVGGSATGEGADVLVFDDPISADQARSATRRAEVLFWYDETMKSRLNDPRTGRKVLIMQRLHEDDLTGHILATEGDDWNHLCLPARYEPDHPTPVRSSIGFRDPRTREGGLLWPARFGEAELRKQARPGSYVEAGQLQQRPAPRQGGFFRADEIGVLDLPPACRRVVRFWDLAGTEGDGDHTAGVKIGELADGSGYCILHVRRGQLSPGAVRRMILATAEGDGRATRLWLPQDPGQAGKAQVASLATFLVRFSPRFLREQGDKGVRAEPLASQIEAGNVWMVRGEWNHAFREELRLFPRGAHDDQVDAAANAFNILTEQAAAPRSPAITTTER